MTIVRNWKDKVYTIDTNGWRIQNVPAYALTEQFITFRICDDTCWFWGAYDTMDKALEAAEGIDGHATPVV